MKKIFTFIAALLLSANLFAAENIIWEGDGSAGAVSWNGTYRFALEGHDAANECIAEIPQAVWDRMMTETFYLDLQGVDPQIRVTTGWWDATWKVGDIQPGNELLTDRGDGTWTLEIDLSDDPDLLALLVEHHLLFTGDRYTPTKIYFKESGSENIWEGDGSAGAVSWNGTYRFALEGHDGANECIAEIPQAVWDRMMAETFYLDLQGVDPQIRVTTGWWDATWKVGDIQPGNELLTDHGDGTWTLEINLSDDPDLLALLVEHHLLFTGDRYTPTKLYFLTPSSIQAPIEMEKAAKGVRYNLSGQKVDAAYKGIVILNGKKFLQK